MYVNLRIRTVSSMLLLQCSDPIPFFGSDGSGPLAKLLAISSVSPSVPSCLQAWRGRW